jgi:competence protein ComEC
VTVRDLGLIGASVGAWCGALLPTVAAATSLAALSVALASVALLARAGRTRGTTVLLVLIVSVGLVAGSVSAAVRASADHASPLRSAAQSGATTSVVAVVTGEPRPLRDGTGGLPDADADLIVGLRVERVVDGAVITAVRSPVTVFAPATWRTIGVGTTVRTSATWSPSNDPRDIAVGRAAEPFVIEPPGPLLQAADHVRAGLRTAAAPVPFDGGRLLPSLVVGDTSTLPETVSDDLRDAGLAHLSAVSGANVAIVLGVVLLVLRSLRVRATGLIIAAVLTVAAFGLVARFEPSVLRASAMALVVLLAALRGGAAKGTSALAAAVLVLVLLDPGLARAPGFVLSVAATGGLLILLPWALRRRRGRARRVVGAAVAAQLAVLPVLVALGGRLDAGGVVANVLVEAAVAPATVLGLAAALVACVHPAPATLLAALGALPAQWIVWVAQAVASTRWAVLPWPGGVVGALAVAGLLLSAVVVVATWRRQARTVGPRLGLVTLVLCGVCVVGLPLNAERGWPPSGWDVVMCDVGQGDALVLKAGHGEAIVVDVGPDAREIDRCLRDLGVDVLPLVVLTHFHADHTTGLAGAMRDRRVGRLLVSPWAEPVAQRDQVMALAAAAAIPVDVVVAGSQTTIAGWRLEALGPLDAPSTEGSVPNNASVVLRAQRGDLGVLLLGDAELEAQRHVVEAAAAALPGIDVLKVAHHGSAVQDPRLIPTVAPALALVGVGCDNRYGHPSPQVVAALHDVGAVVGRTDLHGDLAVVDEGRELIVRGPSSTGGPSARCT